MNKIQPSFFWWRLAWRFTVDACGGAWRIVAIANIVSIGISVIALLLALGIVRGLHQSMEQSLRRFHGDLEAAVLQSNAPETIKKLAHLHGIHKATSSAQLPILISASQQNCTQGIQLIGIEANDTRFSSDLFASRQKPSLSTRSIMLGSTLARILDVTIGDRVRVQYKNEIGENDQRSLTVSDIFTSGIDEYDRYAALASLELVEDLDETVPKQLIISLTPHAHADTVKQELKQLPSITEVYSWQDRYPTFADAMQIERIGLGLLIAVLVLLSALHATAGLVLIAQKKLEQATTLFLRGATPYLIWLIFGYCGIQIISLATIPGTVCAYIIGSLITRYQLIQLPDVYFSSHLIINITVMDMLLVIAGYALIGLITSALVTALIIKPYHR